MSLTSSNPEHAAEEGRLGNFLDFSPQSLHFKPVNYPVGKPLEVSKTNKKNGFS